MTVKRNGGDDGPQTTPRSIGPLRPEDLKSDQRKGEKKITIRVSDETERRMLYEDEVKKLVERVKSVVPEFIEVNRLTNEDIKVTVTNKETKIALLKNTEWIKVIGSSTTLRRRTYSVLIHNIRVKEINTTK